MRGNEETTKVNQKASCSTEQKGIQLENLPKDITQTIKLRSKLVRTTVLSLITQTGAYLAHLEGKEVVRSNEGFESTPPDAQSSMV